MANQPSKYSKFLVGAASAALVASAVAPVASAADFKDTKGNTHETAIDALSDAGVISGYPDGTFLPNKTLTRSDVVKMLGKWLVNTQGVEIPTDYKTKPRFSDQTAKTNDELLKYSAVVKDNGVFNGLENGTLDATADITRENMALVLVRAFDTVNKTDLVAHVAAKEFNKDVTDLATAKAEARPYIDVLDFFDITNPAAPKFNPKATTTRGQFASFLHKTTGVEVSDVNAQVDSITAINATTVEVTFKEAVEDVAASDYSIEGLTVSNAAVKQTNDKVVVLTTSTQEGAKEYTVKSGTDTLGKFKGISAIVPTTIKLVSTSAQSKVGAEVTLKADIGVKAAGVPVTFNVDAPTGSLNKDLVVEAFTNADGIATYSYTQYSAGVDTVAVYPTGAPTVRDFATVYWGVQNILTVESADATTGNVLANGSAKTYKVTYRNPVTGAVVPNQTLNVTFAENMNVTSDKLSTAVVKDVTTGLSFNPYQLTNGNVNAATVKTDSNGQATFTVSGTNTSATPIVFVDTTDNNTGNGKWDTTELFATTEKLTFSGAQLANKFTLTATGSAQTAVGPTNGRKYKVVVTDKDGKPYAGGIVNLALNETIDKEIGTVSNAFFTTNDDLEGDLLTGVNTAKNQLKLNSKGEGEFILSSEIVNDYGTPVVWIDQNVAENHQSGVLENGEPSITGEKTFFEKEAVNSSKLTVTKDGKEFTGTFAGNETAVFTYHATNQSGNTFATNKRVTYTITNNGPDALVVNGNTANPIAAYGTQSVTLDGLTPQATITTIDGSNGAVTVSAAGNVLDTVNGVATVGKYLGTQSASAKFSKYSTAPIATGVVKNVNLSNKTFTVTDAKGKVYNYNYDKSTYQYLGQNTNLAAFEGYISTVGAEVSVTSTDKGELTFNIIKTGTSVGLVAPENVTFIDVDLDAGEIAGEITFTPVADHTYKVYLGATEIVKASGTYTIASNTPYTNEKIKIEATKAGFTASTTIDIVDVKTANETAAALVKINTAAFNKSWDGITVADFATAGVTNVTADNFLDVKTAVQEKRALEGSALTAEQIQAVVTTP